MKKIAFTILLLISFTMVTSCVTKTIMVKCPESGARINVDGDYAGGQEATFKMKLIGWKNVTVTAPKYKSQSFTVRPNSSNIKEVCLEFDPKYEERDYSIKTVPQDAIITVGGKEVAKGSYSFKLDREHYVVAEVSHQGYFSQSIKIKGTDNPGVTTITLVPSERDYVIKTVPEDAIINVGGNNVAQGTYSFKMDKEHYLVADVSRQGFFSQTVRIDGTDEPGIRTVTLIEDDAWVASAPASDIANKNIRFRARSSESDDEIWYTLIRYASDYFGDFVVNDKGAGWAKSTWVTRSFSKISVRSRLEIKRNPGDKKEFTLFLSSEYTTKKDGNKYCTDDECFKPWDRVLKAYVELPSALSTAVQ
ncbi:MAG: hypothetical protein IJP65_09820 [Bacteroidales bacterium]|nr:hypothetical protein [Bacteroidales bacterium]